MKKVTWISNEDYRRIYRQVPRLCVDLVIVSEKGVLLERRKIPPGIGEWHIVGGTLYRGECLEEAVKRIGKKDLGLEVEIVGQLGVIEYVGEEEQLFEGKRHSVAIEFLCMVDEEALQGVIDEDLQIFEVLPAEMTHEQQYFLANKLGMWIEGEPKIEYACGGLEVYGKIPFDEYKYVFSQIVRLTMELVVRNNAGEILLTKRAVEPYMGKWHLVGGTVLKGEYLEVSVNRILEDELGVTQDAVLKVEQLGVLEWESFERFDYPLGVVYEVMVDKDEFVLDEQGSEWRWFELNDLPGEMIEDQRRWVEGHVKVEK